jgi:hypothetical protein
MQTLPLYRFIRRPVRPGSVCQPAQARERLTAVRNGRIRRRPSEVGEDLLPRISAGGEVLAVDTSRLNPEKNDPAIAS